MNVKVTVRAGYFDEHLAAIMPSHTAHCGGLMAVVAPIAED
jgi:hypothetical protein